MREIKFRGRRYPKNGGDFIYGDIEHCYRLDDEGKEYEAIDISGWEVDPATVGQFTGLIDKNGTEIYEGDLIYERLFNGEEYDAISEVVYDVTGFYLKMLKGNKKAMENPGLSSFHIYPKDGNKLPKGEVIGNIHTHPELVEDGR